MTSKLRRLLLTLAPPACPRRPVIIALSLAAIGIAAPARAGTVMRIAGDDIYVDMGAEHGVGAGSTLTLMHTVVATHPVTKRPLRDVFPLGKLKVIKAGARVCIARAPEDIRNRAKIGDAVVLASPKRAFVDPWQEQVERSRKEAAGPRVGPGGSNGAPRGGGSRDARAVSLAWQQTLGKPPGARIAIWERFLAGDRDNAYAGSVRAEIAALRKQIAEFQRIAANRVRPAKRRRAERAARLRAIESKLSLDHPLALRPIEGAVAGRELALAFAVLDSAELASAWLYHRVAGETSFERSPLRFDGDGYLRGRVPRKAVRAPAIEMFVEATTVSDSTPKAVLGSQALPLRAAVGPAETRAAPDRRRRSRITVFTDYVDFDGGLSAGFDQYLQFEVDFMYRFYRPIYSVRVGFGTLSGTGGPKDIIDQGNECLDAMGNYRCRRVAYNFGYAELELRLSEMFAIMIRPQFGTGTSDRRPGAGSTRCLRGDLDADCDFFNAIGGRGRVRIGKETETNLVLGIGFTDNVGTMIEAAFTWDVVPKVPIVLSFQVTDQPVPEDFGVRLIVDAGWRALPWVYPSLRLAYQGRDIDHGGLSFGGALNFDW